MMITIYDDETLAAARGDITDRKLAALIDRIAHDAKASDLWEFTCILVIDAADTADDIERVLGFDPLIGPLDEGGLPYWSWLERHGRWYEMLITAGDSGFAYFVLVQDQGADRSGLAALCREHAGNVKT